MKGFYKTQDVNDTQELGNVPYITRQEEEAVNVGQVLGVGDTQH